MSLQTAYRSESALPNVDRDGHCRDENRGVLFTSNTWGRRAEEGGAPPPAAEGRLPRR